MTIAIYGASGHTGQLVTAELVRQGAQVVLGGRDGDKLRRLAERYGNPPVRVAAVDHPATLRRLLDGCDAVVNCAGPASVCGEAVVRAALATGTPYADAAGEQPFIRRVFEDYGAEAERQGIPLIPALGFDYAVGDCLARITARGHEPAAEVVVAYAVGGSGVPGNSLRFAAETPAGDEVVYRDGRWRPARVRVDRATFDFPPPLGRQRMGRYGSAEVLTVPRHTRTHTVTTLITASSLVPHPALLPLFPWLRPAATLLRRTPLRRLLAAAGRWTPKTPPGDDQRATATFTIGTLVRGEDGSVARGLIRGRDFEGLTAAILAYGALQMARGQVPVAGALAPAVAFDPCALLDHLGGHGVIWSVER